MNKYEVSSRPLDTPTDVTYNGNVIVSSWDGKLYVYGLQNREMKSTYCHSIPISRTLVSGGNILFADILGNIKSLSSEYREISSDKTSMDGVHTLEEYNGMYIMCGWSSKLCLIQNNNLEYVEIGLKTQASSLFGDKLALIEGNSVHILDMKTYKLTYTRRMNEQLRSVKLDGNLLYLGTYGGKLRVVDLDLDSENVINAHQTISGDKKILYPVNQIEKYTKIYTCGSDGVLNRFSIGNKISQKIIQSFDQGILRFKKIDSKFVVCCGYNYEKGVGETNYNPVYIFDA
ncbi:Mitotic checkpoint protein bub3 [Nosema granulosis]|uniref:Mitotic checkpoint protein bub3 n=1 Tax=Nosema granulosis TaxID=83296 RepID=A0A9P6L038_9MICR|nr:Mitotic checkpoint protein bub3 [Nosema granulosis]